MSSAAQVIVVGAGLVGTSVARSLARAGCRVDVIERGVPGAEASWAAGGILSPQVEAEADGPFLRLGLRGLDAMRTLCAELAADDLSVPLRTGGTWDVAADDAEATHLRGRVAWQQAAGLQAQFLDADVVATRLPLLGPQAGAAFYPDEASLEPRVLFEALRVSAQRAGARFVTGRRVQDVGEHHVTLDGDERSVADVVVVCAGAWTPQVAGVQVPDDAIFPVKGQMLEVQSAPGTFADVDAVIYGHGGYIVPRSDGRVVSGSTMERASFDKHLTVAGLEKITHLMGRMAPSLKDAVIRDQWAGIRPGTVDGVPLLGRTSDGVWVASGHFRNGVLLAAVSGVVMKEAIVDDVAIDAAYAPDRFRAARR